MPVPDDDEAFFANPALNLLHQGNFGSSTLAGLLGFDPVTLWFPPLQSLTLVIPIKLFGLQLWSIRLMSVLWGLLTLVALFRTGVLLGMERKAGLLFLLFLGTDFSFLNLARLARDEALLGFLDSAMLLCLARASLSNRRTPLVIAGILAGLSFLTHPLALFSLPAFLLFPPPKRPAPEEPIGWKAWTQKALLFGGAIGVTRSAEGVAHTDPSSMVSPRPNSGIHPAAPPNGVRRILAKWRSFARDVGGFQSRLFLSAVYFLVLAPRILNSRGVPSRSYSFLSQTWSKSAKVLTTW